MSTVVIRQNQTLVRVTGSEPRSLTVRDTRVAQVTGIGPRGPQGLPGASGADQDSFDFTQASPTAVWVIPHNLGREPIVQTYTVGGLQMFGAVQHLSDNQVNVYFNAPTAGTARLI